MADAFGRMVEDYYRDDLADDPVHRREDGVTWPAICEWYFSSPAEWPSAERSVLERATGRVLDLGCGVGRTTLFLQDTCAEVVALDRSRRALRVARDRGVETPVVGDMTSLPMAAPFDTVVAMGGQLGAVGDIEGLRTLLDALAATSGSGTTLLADFLDRGTIDDDDRQAYLAANEIEPDVSVRRFRVEYDGSVGPWVDLLVLTPDALRRVVTDAWEVTAVERSEGSFRAVLRT